MRNAVIVFTRAPIPGKTKTRLMPLLSGGECCLLHRAFIRDLAEVLREAGGAGADGAGGTGAGADGAGGTVGTGAGAGGGFDIIAYYTPEGAAAELEALMPGAGAFLPQRGETLGEKMHNAIKETLGKGYKRCLLVGSDLPLLRPETVRDAFRSLDASDIVVCPTEDGGYYLVGMKEPCEEIFNIAEYGVSTVFEKTLAAAAKAGKTCAVGAATMDVDEPQDLRLLVEKLALERPDLCQETRKVLRSLEHAINITRS